MPARPEPPDLRSGDDTRERSRSDERSSPFRARTEVTRPWVDPIVGCWTGVPACPRAGAGHGVPGAGSLIYLSRARGVEVQRSNHRRPADAPAPARVSEGSRD